MDETKEEGNGLAPDATVKQETVADDVWTVDSVAGNVDSEAGNVDTVTGVTVSAYQNRPQLWKPGQSGNPSGRRKADTFLINTIAAEFPPSEIVMMVRSAWASAVARNSPKAKIEIAEFVADRIMGKPRQFINMAKGSPKEFLEALSQVQLPEQIEDTE